MESQESCFSAFDVAMHTDRTLYERTRLYVCR